jgi:hypothetical protein
MAAVDGSDPHRLEVVLTLTSGIEAIAEIVAHTACTERPRGPGVGVASTSAPTSR